MRRRLYKTRLYIDKTLGKPGFIQIKPDAEMHRLTAFTHTTIKTLQKLIITTMYRILYMNQLFHSNTL